MKFFLTKKPLNILQQLEIELLIVVVLIFAWASIFSHFESLSLFDSLYFSVISLAGIWYGDIVPQTIYGKIVAMVYAIIWIPMYVIAGTLIVEILKWRK